MSDPTRRLAEWLDGEGYVVCEWDGDPEWAGRSVLTPVEGWEDAARAALSTTPAPLDAAWAEAEAALPEGWRVTRLDYLRLRGEWTAMAEHQRDAGSVSAEGPTPAAALLALAEKLREFAKP